MMNSKKKYYVNDNEVLEYVDKITRIQSNERVYVNIKVKPYKGKKYGEGTKVIIVG